MEKKKPTVIKHLCNLNGILCYNLNVSTTYTNPKNNSFLFLHFEMSAELMQKEKLIPLKDNGVTLNVCVRKLEFI